MENSLEMQEFKVLGIDISFKAETSENEVSASEVVGLVNAKAEEISQSLPHLDKNQIAVLVALKLAQDNLKNTATMNEELNSIRSSAIDALKYIEEVSPGLN